MTESDAMAFGERDAHTALHRAQQAQGPEDVERLLMNFLFNRFDGLNLRSSRQAKTAVRSVERGVSMSLRVARRCRIAFDVALRTMEPEDTRALLLWAMGAPGASGGQGFIPPLLAAFPDDQTAASIKELEGAYRRVQATIQHRDQELFAHARALPAHHKAIVFGRIERARMLSEEGDGESARYQLIFARQLARKLVDHAA